MPVLWPTEMLHTWWKVSIGRRISSDTVDCSLKVTFLRLSVDDAQAIRHCGHQPFEGYSPANPKEGGAGLEHNKVLKYCPVLLRNEENCTTRVASLMRLSLA